MLECCGTHDSGPRGRRFESSRPDHFFLNLSNLIRLRRRQRVTRNYRMSRASAAQLASDNSQVRGQDSLTIKSKLFVDGRQLARALRLAQTCNCQMRMKEAPLAGKTCFFAFSFQRLV